MLFQPESYNQGANSVEEEVSLPLPCQINHCRSQSCHSGGLNLSGFAPSCPAETTQSHFLASTPVCLVDQAKHVLWVTLDSTFC